MNADFSRTLALLRQEKEISQRKAAADLGISQALLSHYENGVREPGLAFVKKACDYYHVSADYLLGRTLDRDGGIARRVAAQEGQRSGVSAVVHLAGELFRLEEGDVLGVGDDELTLGLSRRHHQLTQNSLRLLRRSDADGVLPHDACGQRGQTLHRAAHTVRADGRDGADRHLGQGRCQTGIRQPHHSQLAARRTKAAGSRRQY